MYLGTKRVEIPKIKDDMNMAKNKFYVVWVGRKPGIYDSWQACQEQIDHFPKAKYKSYKSKLEAEKAYQASWQKAYNISNSTTKSKATFTSEASLEENSAIIYDSISVDAACSGNPGILEYQGVDTKTGENIFHQGPIPKGTNNLGEFLAIVHALALLKKEGSSKAIYTDSITAMSWVRNKRVNTNLVKDTETEYLWSLIDRAIAWLDNNTYSNSILKWETDKWGEIKADFGRK